MNFSFSFFYLRRKIIAEVLHVAINILTGKVAFKSFNEADVFRFLAEAPNRNDYVKAVKNKLVTQKNKEKN